MLKKSIFIILMFILASCVVPVKTDIKQFDASPSVSKELSPFPPNPSIKEYSRKPIITGQENNFVVSDEFVENSLKYKVYYDKIQMWKTTNDIK